MTASRALHAARHATLTPPEVHYILEKLLADRRVSRRDVDRYLDDMRREIADLEQRLADLRAAHGMSVSAVAHGSTRSRDGKMGRKKVRRGNPIAGRYMGYMRQVPEQRKSKYKRIKEESGYEAAIAALKKDLRK